MLGAGGSGTEDAGWREVECACQTCAAWGQRCELGAPAEAEPGRTAWRRAGGTWSQAEGT
eukprot:2305608-Rhodomonas_salina.1